MLGCGCGVCEQALEWNLSRFRCLGTARTITIQAGLGDGTQQHRTLRFYPRLAGSSTMEEEGQDGGVVVGRGMSVERRQELREGVESVEGCRMLTLAQVLERHVPQDRDVALLKVDVEGAELAVLRGLPPQGWRRVRQVVVEVHARGADPDGPGRAPREEVEALLRTDAGFDQVAWVQEDWAVAAGVDTWLVFATRTTIPPPPP